MSPLWTSRWVKGGTGPQASVGIAMGRREVCAVHAIIGAKGVRLQAIHSAQLPEGMFANQPTPEMETHLASAFAKVAAPAKEKFIPCHVAFPDPTMRFAVFELDELPKSEKTRLDLVRWRFAKEHTTGDQSLHCAYQDLGRENGKHLLLGQATDHAWLQCIKQALQRADLTPWSMNLGAAYRFNQFHDRFAKEKQGAAMVILDPDSWSVFIWNATARPQLVRSRWRNGVDHGIETYDAIALEVERSILAYVRSGKHGAIAKMYAAAHASELEGLADALDRRLRERCIALAAPGTDSEEGHKFMNHGLAALSLAAACA